MLKALKTFFLQERLAPILLLIMGTINTMLCIGKGKILASFFCVFGLIFVACAIRDAGRGYTVAPIDVVTIGINVYLSILLILFIVFCI